MPVGDNSVKSSWNSEEYPGVEAAMTEDVSGEPAADSIVVRDEAQVLEILRQSVLGLWDVVNNLTRLTPTRRPKFRVSNFGSARISRDHWAHAAVRDLLNTPHAMNAHRRN